MNGDVDQSSRALDGLRSATVIVDRSQVSSRVRVPEWATIARVHLVGGASAAGEPGDVVDGVMSVRAGTSLRVVVGRNGSTVGNPDGSETAIVRDGVSVACAAGASVSRGRPRSKPGPLWDVRVGQADPADEVSVHLEFIGPEGRGDLLRSIDGDGRAA